VIDGRAAVTAAAALLALGPAVSAAPAAKIGARHDWTQSFSQSPDGGFVIGNPKAKIALVEYGSLTCPHCRHFAETAMKPLLAKYVRSGKASYEYRSLVLNSIDVAATLVARCDGPKHFFPIADELYATQPTWIGKITDADAEKLNGLPPGEQMLGVAKVTGLIPIAASHGVPPAKTEACLKSQSAADQLEQMVQAAQDRGVQGTPTFFVNGKQVPAYDWATLEPFLKESGG
jgi:protein-disulfide isomerase